MGKMAGGGGKEEKDDSRGEKTWRGGRGGGGGQRVPASVRTCLFSTKVNFFQQLFELVLCLPSRQSSLSNSCFNCALSACHQDEIAP